MTLGDFKGKINGMVLSASLGKAARCGGEGQQRTAVAVKTWTLSVKPLFSTVDAKEYNIGAERLMGLSRVAVGPALFLHCC
jgi:hypothetical protein